MAHRRREQMMRPRMCLIDIIMVQNGLCAHSFLWQTVLDGPDPSTQPTDKSKLTWLKIITVDSIWLWFLPLEIIDERRSPFRSSLWLIGRHWILILWPSARHWPKLRHHGTQCCAWCVCLPYVCLCNYRIQYCSVTEALILECLAQCLPWKWPPRFLTDGRTSMTKSGLACVYYV